MNDNPTTENPVLPLSEKYALTIKEAAIYFNIGKSRKHGRWIAKAF